MISSFFVSDLHGAVNRYEKLFLAIDRERPDVVFIGGDFLPWPWPLPASSNLAPPAFIENFLTKRLLDLRARLRSRYPKIFLIMGNDDSRSDEPALREASSLGIWDYLHNQKESFRGIAVYGYSYVPPTPFQLKDWERYDVSRYLDPGAVSPEEGFRTVPASEREMRYATIKEDLERLAGQDDVSNAIFLFHAPPYKTKLDLSAQSGKMIDQVPLDAHLGSIAIRRFIETRQPLLTLHGHIHEAGRLSRTWRDRLGRTHCFSAAHDGPELALIRFNPENLDAAVRDLI